MLKMMMVDADADDGDDVDGGCDDAQYDDSNGGNDDCDAMINNIMIQMMLMI